MAPRTWGNAISVNSSEDEKLLHLRIERDKKLSDTDWIILRNLETNEPVPKEWLDYRQALRDFPENVKDLENVIWPEKPSEG